ncbi:hypothetical protein NEOLEDRAFT_1184317 [Neolentinus lepideus HHB14362 ss-1]|uniref:Uncharacterized protein n=1 Tax=Neolentinus lepideus HHB14362 ss-1 TaxID=1314782 RepID=A0A165MJV1_9AGAM|nr:hypothetical protein NEOLEDRAFT_1184317 [Neolentinus lepideus HHB14362 ss-1]
MAGQNNNDMNQINTNKKNTSTPVVQAKKGGKSKGPSANSKKNKIPTTVVEIAAQAATTRAQAHDAHKAVEADLEKITLGYALLSLIGNNDGGEGPEIQPSPYNPRMITPKALTALWNAFEVDGILNHHLAHAMTIAVKKDLLDQSTLVSKQDIQQGKDAERLTWLKKDGLAYLLAGQHRREAIRKTIEDHEKSIAALTKRLSKPRLTDDLRKDLQAQFWDAKDNLERESTWLVQIIDLDKLQRHDQSALLADALTSNRSLPHEQDDATDVLIRSLNVIRIAIQKDETAGSATSTHLDNTVASLIKSHEDKSLHALLREPKFRSMLMRLYQWMPLQQSPFFSCSGWGACVREARGTLFACAIEELLDLNTFLSDPRDVIAFPDDPSKLTSELKSRVLNDSKAIIQTAIPQYEALGPILDKSQKLFHDHLHPVISGYHAHPKVAATRLQVYQEAFTLYRKSLKEIIEEELQCGKALSDLGRQTLNHMWNKLQWVVDGGIFEDEYWFSPHTPLLCGEWVSYLDQQMILGQGWLAMQAYQLEPFCDAQWDAKGAREWYGAWDGVWENLIKHHHWSVEKAQLFFSKICCLFFQERDNLITQLQVFMKRAPWFSTQIKRQAPNGVKFPHPLGSWLDHQYRPAGNGSEESGFIPDAIELIKGARLGHNVLGIDLDMFNKGYSPSWLEDLERDAALLAKYKTSHGEKYLNAAKHLMESDVWDAIGPAFEHSVYTLIIPNAAQVGLRDTTKAEKLGKLLYVHNEALSYYYQHGAAWELRKHVFSIIRTLYPDASMSGYFWDGFLDNSIITQPIMDSNMAIGISESLELQFSQSKALKSFSSQFIKLGLGGIPTEDGSLALHPEMALALEGFTSAAISYFVKENIFYTGNKTIPPPDDIQSQVKWWRTQNDIPTLPVATDEQVRAYFKVDEEDLEENPVILVPAPPPPPALKQNLKRKLFNDNLLARMKQATTTIGPNASSTSTGTSSASHTAVDQKSSAQGSVSITSTSRHSSSSTSSKNMQSGAGQVTKSKRESVVARGGKGKQKEFKSSEFIQSSDSEEDMPLSVQYKEKQAPKSPQIMESSDTEEDIPLKQRLAKAAPHQITKDKGKSVGSGGGRKATKSTAKTKGQVTKDKGKGVASKGGRRRQKAPKSQEVVNPTHSDPPPSQGNTMKLITPDIQEELGINPSVNPEMTYDDQMDKDIQRELQGEVNAEEAISLSQGTRSKTDEPEEKTMVADGPSTLDTLVQSPQNGDDPQQMENNIQMILCSSVFGENVPMGEIPGFRRPHKYKYFEVETEELPPAVVQQLRWMVVEGVYKTYQMNKDSIYKTQLHNLKTHFSLWGEIYANKLIHRCFFRDINPYPIKFMPLRCPEPVAWDEEELYAIPEGEAFPQEFGDAWRCLLGVLGLTKDPVHACVKKLPNPKEAYTAVLHRYTLFRSPQTLQVMADDPERLIEVLGFFLRVNFTLRVCSPVDTQSDQNHSSVEEEAEERSHKRRRLVSPAN